MIWRSYVVGQWGIGRKDLHHFIQVCAKSRVAHLTRATGRQESEHLLGLIVGQYRRLLSVTAVRAHAMCLLARVGQGEEGATGCLCDFTTVFHDQYGVMILIFGFSDIFHHNLSINVLI